MNWVETILLITKAGYTQSQIADECGCAQPTISDLAGGRTKNPGFQTGQALLKLEAKAKRKLAHPEKAGS
jgi:transcriptional regulator with XRE-family HTH domain